MNMSLIDSERPAVDYYQRDAGGDWLVGQLEPSEILTVECEGYRAELRFEDIFEDVRWPGTIKTGMMP